MTRSTASRMSVGDAEDSAEVAGVLLALELVERLLRQVDEAGLERTQLAPAD